jgi:hypothetical protein
MDLMLTSFGVSHLPRSDSSNADIFYRMPPASLASAGQEFLPDYAVLLLADRIVIDKRTYELLITGRHSSYGQVALMVKTLYDEGFVRLEDFDSVIARNRELLEKMLERDINELDSWVIPLRESVAEWRRFVEAFKGSLRLDFLDGRLRDGGGDADEREFYQSLLHRAGSWLHGSIGYSYRVQYLVEGALESSHKRRGAEHRQALRDTLTEYISYINANLLLSNELGVGFHDWADFRPFYRDKFMRVARLSGPGQREIDSIKQLFTVSFPEFAFWTPQNIVRALNDKRIVDLRRLVESAVNGQVEFDREFAIRVLGEVLKIERSIGKLRNFVSYVTTPLGFIPVAGTPVQKIVEEAIVQPTARRREKEYRWFFLISELGGDLRSAGSDSHDPSQE